MVSVDCIPEPALDLNALTFRRDTDLIYAFPAGNQGESYTCFIVVALVCLAFCLA